ncbi:uncharacterized protein LOC117112311 [Anneissia japonica]|uniref:uncharacterized protein LOC117112311 n=1 Tax=Anneissia japonica TaxID=1529436 RepID=UPI001425ACF7|nr:uncharacterized protein LOC117112311 [Anneissia japonica]
MVENDSDVEMWDILHEILVVLQEENYAQHVEEKIMLQRNVKLSLPLIVAGCFTAVVKAGDRKVTTEFVVIEEKGEPIMSSRTAQELGVLHIGLGLNAVKSCEGLRREYKPVFNEIGKLKNCQVKLTIDPRFKLVAKPVRRTPFGLRRKVELKIQELTEKDIIEPVEAQHHG